MMLVQAVRACGFGRSSCGKSSSVNSPLRSPLFALGHLVLVELLLGLLDQRQHVAHAQDALGHPLGMELLRARRDVRRCR